MDVNQESDVQIFVIDSDEYVSCRVRSSNSKMADDKNECKSSAWYADFR